MPTTYRAITGRVLYRCLGPQNAEVLLPIASYAPLECRTDSPPSRSALAAFENYDPRRSRTSSVAPYGVEGLVEATTNILTIKEVADILRCSKTHAQNVIEGKVRGLPKLTHLSIGRRKVIRKEWLDQWMEANKTL